MRSISKYLSLDKTFFVTISVRLFPEMITEAFMLPPHAYSLPTLFLV